MSPTAREEDAPRAVVVFSGRADLAWLRLLRPGFRHCFILLHTGKGWLYLNPLAHRTEISLLDLPGEFDVAGWYRQRDMVALTTRPRRPPHRAAPWRPHTCVETVKRILGIHAGWVLTPWQLYRHIVASEYCP